MDKVFISYMNNGYGYSEYSIVQEVLDEEGGLIKFKTLEDGIKSEFEAEVRLKEYLRK